MSTFCVMCEPVQIMYILLVESFILRSWYTDGPSPNVVRKSKSKRKAPEDVAEKFPARKVAKS